jgi:hypothetical protein
VDTPRAQADQRKGQGLLVMKLKVVIHRGGKETPYYGSLRAWVFQGGRVGANLLKGHCYTNVDKAKQEVVAKLPAGTEIEWEVRE